MAVWVVLVVLWWLGLGLLCAFAVDAIAKAKGRSGTTWSLLCVLYGFFPLLVLYMLPAVAPKGRSGEPVQETASQQAQAESGSDPAGALIAQARHDLNHGASVRQVRSRARAARTRGELSVEEFERVEQFLAEVPKHGSV
jgi:hypothetical protein